jgi:UDP-N-acetylmuramate--alanine ligase
MIGSTHFIGIGGTGLSAIARVLMERGEAVTGSDREESPLSRSLRESGATVTIGHAAGNVNGAVRVVRSSAVGDDHVEVQAARAKGIPVYKRSEFFDELLADQQVIAVSGSHGKTTTTAMLAWMLTALNQRPGYIIGSVAHNLNANAAAGAGRLFVIEADEYDYAFLGLSPQIALVTNVEHDHPDMFPTPQDFTAAFHKFVDRVKADGIVIACSDDTGGRELLAYAGRKGLQTRSYAYSQSDADYKAGNLQPLAGAGYSFSVARGDQYLVDVRLQVPGVHNVQNALGALVIADELGLSLSEAAQTLADFRGTSRRFEIRGEAAGVLVVDDYAHHPTEIISTLTAAKARYPQRRIVAVWQPHTYSRTLALESEFARSFANADAVFVTDVYASREKQPAGFDMSAIVSNISHGAGRFSGDLVATRAQLNTALKSGDVLIIMSAGDAIQLSEQIFSDLQSKEEQHA